MITMHSLLLLKINSIRVARRKIWGKKAHTERQKSICASFEKLNAINRLIKLIKRDEISQVERKALH